MTEANGKTLAAVVSEVKDDLKEFLDTRLQMLAGEMKQKISVWEMALPALGIALLLAAVGFLLLAIALVAATASAVGWGWSFLIVGCFYFICAGGMAFLAYREIHAEGLAPTRTLRVLKQDKVWLENEARSQL